MSLKGNNGNVKSRMQRRQQKKQQWKPTLFVNDDEGGKKTSRHDSEAAKIRVRLIPIWLRIIIIAVLFVLCVIIGAIVGYSLIGEGSFSEVFQKSTWTKVFDLIEKE